MLLGNVAWPDGRELGALSRSRSPGHSALPGM